MKKLTFFANKNHFKIFVYVEFEMTRVFIIAGINVYPKKLILYSYFMITFSMLLIMSNTIFQQLTFGYGLSNKVPPT